MRAAPSRMSPQTYFSDAHARANLMSGLQCRTRSPFVVMRLSLASRHPRPLAHRPFCLRRVQYDATWQGTLRCQTAQLMSRQKRMKMA